jgi:16S rRNA (uracil1498-N3)-methyltransferase
MRNTPSLHSVLVSSPALTSAVMLVGPEGGWTDDETQLLTSHNFTGVSLGNLILRTETAAIAALASIRYELSSRMQSR